MTDIDRQRGGRDEDKTKATSHKNPLSGNLKYIKACCTQSCATNLTMNEIVDTNGFCIINKLSY